MLTFVNVSTSLFLSLCVDSKAVGHLFQARYPQVLPNACCRNWPYTCLDHFSSLKEKLFDKNLPHHLFLMY